MAYQTPHQFQHSVVASSHACDMPQLRGDGEHQLVSQKPSQSMVMVLVQLCFHNSSGQHRRRDRGHIRVG